MSVKAALLVHRALINGKAVWSWWWSWWWWWPARARARARARRMSSRTKEVIVPTRWSVMEANFIRAFEGGRLTLAYTGSARATTGLITLHCIKELH